MNKEKYEQTEIEVIAFKTADVLLASDPDEYEGERAALRPPVI